MSILSAWQQSNGSQHWAVLVYIEGGCEYYRMPGFLGSGANDWPSGSAGVYRFRAGVNEEFIYGPASPLNAQDAPLFVQAQPRALPGLESAFYREPQFSEAALPAQRDAMNQYIMEHMDKDAYSNIKAVHTPVLRDRVDGKGPTNETVVQHIYHYYNTYMGIRLSDAYVALYQDAQGLSSVHSQWKAVTAVDHAKESGRRADTAQILAAARQAGGSGFNPVATEAVYEPVDAAGAYKLHYQVRDASGRAVLVDAETGEARQRG